jgi:hypothetical protein
VLCGVLRCARRVTRRDCRHDHVWAPLGGPDERIGRHLVAGRVWSRVQGAGWRSRCVAARKRARPGTPANAPLLGGSAGASSLPALTPPPPKNTAADTLHCSASPPARRPGCRCARRLRALARHPTPESWRGASAAPACRACQASAAPPRPGGPPCCGRGGARATQWRKRALRRGAWRGAMTNPCERRAIRGLEAPSMRAFNMCRHDCITTPPLPHTSARARHVTVSV